MRKKRIVHYEQRELAHVEVGEGFVTFEVAAEFRMGIAASNGLKARAVGGIGVVLDHQGV